MRGTAFPHFGALLPKLEPGSRSVPKHTARGHRVRSLQPGSPHPASNSRILIPGSQVNWAVAGLAKAVYARMFKWLISRCNKTLDAKEIQRE